ncbi:MAG: hypothetical protein L0H37_08135 [Nitrosospira sp.]|nr:hypothetical protein [Nitrosospira sp.]
MTEPKPTGDLPHKLKRSLLYSFIAFLAISALIAIVTVIAGSFSDFTIKVLITTTTIAGASICLLCAGAYGERRHVYWPGIASGVLVILAATLIIGGAWLEASSEEYWKTTAVIGVFAIADAHSLALLAVPLRRDHVWLRPVTTASIVLLACLVSILIVMIGYLSLWQPWKLGIVLAILVALETLVIPLLSRLTKSEATPQGATLLLTRRSHGIYEDKQGRVYELRDITDDCSRHEP